MYERMSEKSRTQCGILVSENSRIQLEFRAVAAVMMTWQISGSLHETLYMTKQKKKEKKKIYTENKIGRYVQFLIEREDFLELVASWLLSIEDERMQLLRQFIFEVELSETEELKNVLYQYGSYLTEKNYLERKFFEYMAELVRKMEQNRRAAALPAAIE